MNETLLGLRYPFDPPTPLVCAVGCGREATFAMQGPTESPVQFQQRYWFCSPGCGMPGLEAPFLGSAPALGMWWQTRDGTAVPSWVVVAIRTPEAMLVPIVEERPLLAHVERVRRTNGL